MAELNGSDASEQQRDHSPDELAPITPNRPDDSNTAANIAFNQAIIHALAGQLVSTHSQQPMAQANDLILAADRFPHARHLLLLAVIQACHLSTKPAGLAAMLMKVLKAQWGAVEGSGACTSAVTVEVTDEEGVPVAAHFKHWEKKAAKSHAAVLQQALLAALQHASAQELPSLSSHKVRLAHTFVLQSQHAVCWSYRFYRLTC